LSGAPWGANIKYYRGMSKSNSADIAFDRLTARVSRLRAIRRPIASDVWTYTDASGTRRKTRISVARPRPIPQDPKGDWYCAVHVSGWRRHIIPAFGIGPLDSLANALQVVQFFKEEIGTSHIIWKRGKASRIQPRVP
jgi:hypothetical protein